MPNPSILYTDLSTYTVSSSHGTNTSYPLSNLKNYMETSYWIGSTKTENQRLIFDLGSAVPVTTVVIAGHNLTAAATDNGIFIQYADDAAFTSGVTSATEITSTGDDITIRESFGTVTKRYWAIYWSGTVPFAAFPRIGNVFFGTPMEFTTPYDNGYKIENAEYKTNEATTLSGTSRMSQTYKGRIIYEIKFSLQNTALKTAFQTFVKTVRGRMYPFYFIDSDGTQRYMHLDSDYVPVSSTNATGYYNIETLKLRTQASTF